MSVSPRTMLFLGQSVRLFNKVSKDSKHKPVSPISTFTTSLSWGLMSRILPFIGPFLCTILLLLFGSCLRKLITELISSRGRQVHLQLLLQQGYQPLSRKHQDYYGPWTGAVKPSATGAQAPLHLNLTPPPDGPDRYQGLGLY